jgi:rhodanese-related sulfurtransferase
VQAVRERMGQPDLQIVDIRDIRELQHEGTVPGSYHAPRGMLEFWVDPGSPYFKKVFADESREFVLFCGAGWRSALAAKALQKVESQMLRDALTRFKTQALAARHLGITQSTVARKAKQYGIDAGGRPPST